MNKPKGQEVSQMDRKQKKRIKATVTIVWRLWHRRKYDVTLV